MSLIMLVGRAGSGKSEVARILSEDFDAALVAQAAPMKDFVEGTFGFTWNQLHGPSEARNAVDDRYEGPEGDRWRECVAESIADAGREWVADVLSDASEDAQHRAFRALCDWAMEVLDGGQITPRRVLQTLGTEWGRVHGGRDMWSRYALRKASEALDVSPMAVVVDGRFRNEVLNARAAGARIVRISTLTVADVRSHVSEQEIDGMPATWFHAELLNDRAAGLDALRHTVKAMVRRLCPAGWVFHV